VFDTDVCAWGEPEPESGPEAARTVT